MVRILLCGDVRGRLGFLSENIAKIHARLEPAQYFQAVFCVGEFSAEDMDLQLKLPVPVHFIDTGPAATDLIEASPQGEEVAVNLHFLGHFGVTTIAGLKVAFLSGRRHPELFGEEAPIEEDASATEALVADAAGLRERYGVQDIVDGIQLGPECVPAASAPKQGPSWEELKAKEERTAAQRSQLFINGCYTPLAIERLQEEIADVGGVDLLLTSEWPTGVLRGVPSAWPEEVGTRRMVKAAVKRCCSVAVAQITAAAEPKYHAVGLGGVFWRRPPWKHERRGEVVASTGELRCGVCRLIALGAADGSQPGLSNVQEGSSAAASAPPKPQKWLHGLDLDPSNLPAGADDATPSPWSEKVASGIGGSVAGAEAEAVEGLVRPDFSLTDKEERRRWTQRFGCVPEEMQRLSDRLAKAAQPKEKKDKHKSLYKVSEKEKKRRKTGGDGHLPFHAKERMASNKG